MEYLDVYLSRINHLGHTTAERIRNGGIRSFEKWMAESPHTVNNLSVERGVCFSGIILTSKDKEYEKIMFLNITNDTDVIVGDIMTWPLEDGTEEKWIVVQEEKKVNGTYRTFWIIRCNYLLKWVDANGHLQTSWSYVVSSVDSKIKGNYRTWNNLITPQPNKYAEILMPRYAIDRATNFIIEDESWAVIEYDHTSVPGTIYLSLTENKVNLIYDDLTNNIADTDKLAVYSIDVPANAQQFVVGTTIEPIFTIMKNGIPQTLNTTLTPVDTTMIQLINGNLIGQQAGTTEITVSLNDYPTVSQNIEVQLTTESSVFTAYIEGPNTIRLDRDATYTLQGTSAISDNVVFTVNNELATISATDINSCTIHANDKNILGSLVLTATYNGANYTKTIQVIPLW